MASAPAPAAASAPALAQNPQYNDTVNPNEFKKSAIMAVIIWIIFIIFVLFGLLSVSEAVETKLFTVLIIIILAIATGYPVFTMFKKDDYHQQYGWRNFLVTLVISTVIFLSIAGMMYIWGNQSSPEIRIIAIVGFGIMGFVIVLGITVLLNQLVLKDVLEENILSLGDSSFVVDIMRKNLTALQKKIILPDTLDNLTPPEK